MLKIYNASAGSGKTSRLVNEYLKLVLLNPASYKNILAITFTNNAAAEMKSRIIEALKQLSGGGYKTMDEALKELSLKADLKAQAQKALDNILHDYSNFSISTIDSFFHRIIKAFAKELNLPIGFDVELDTDTVLDEAIEMLLGDIKSDDALFQDIEKYIYELISDERGWNIDKQLFNLGLELFRESFLKLNKPGSTAGISSAAKKEFIELLSKHIRDFEGKMNKYSNEAEKLLDRFNLSYEDFTQGKKGVGNYLINCLRTGNFTPNSYVLNALNSNNWSSKTSLKRMEIDKCVSAGLGSILTEALQLYDRDHRFYVTCRTILRNLYLSGFLSRLAAAISEYRRQNRVFLISDTNIFLKNVIGNEDTPFIYEKTGIQYNHFLIDEFQDTSALQWENLHPLVANVLSEGNTALIVGDVKQSIYRWRGGDMNLLLGKVYDDLDKFETEKRSLDKNFRSRENIITFNNNFFRRIIEFVSGKFIEHKQVFEKVFEDVIQKPNDKKGGYVQVKFIEQSESKKENTGIAKEECYKIIKELLEKNYSLKDIMLLIRNNKESYLISEYLHSKGIKIVSPESLQIKNSFLVQFLINIFRYIANNSNKVAEKQIWYYYCKEILGKEDELQSVFAPGDQGKQFDLFPGSIVTKLGKLPLYEIAEEAIRMFRLNERTDIYLQRFLDMILEFTKDYGNDINEFVRWWDLHKDAFSVINSPDDDAVTLMTIHKAKGLQKPAVIIPFANWELQKAGESRMWVASDDDSLSEHSPFLVNYNKDLLSTFFGKEYSEEKAAGYIDNLNLLYVAFTRPEDKLFIISPRTGKKSGNMYTDLRDVFTKYQPDGMTADTDGLTFHMGEFDEREIIEVKNESIDEYLIEKFISNDWHKELITRSKGHSLNVIPDESVGEKIDAGVILHEALSRLRDAGSIDLILDEMIFEGIIESSRRQSLKSEIESILSLPVVKEWFSGNYEAKAEKEIITAGGKTLRPDRVMFRKGGSNSGEIDSAVVADYKTGVKKDEHKVQVREYREALEEMNYKNVKGYLVYVDSKEVEEV